jgi:hypothetical protein
MTGPGGWLNVPPQYWPAYTDTPPRWWRIKMYWAWITHKENQK